MDLWSFVLGFGAGKSAGGGGSLKVATGSFTPESDIAGKNITITHNLGVIPQIFVICAEEEPTSTIGRTIYGIYCAVNSAILPNSAFMGTVYYTVNAENPTYGGMNAGNAGRTNFIGALTETDAVAIAYNDTIRYVAGTKYNWIAIAGL